MKNSNKKLFFTGIKYMSVALPLLFIGPYLITLGFLNKTNASFYIFFPIGLIIATAAVYFAFKGIQTLIKSIFD